MKGKIEYLVQYSVAPPPSRDYYGLKVLRDEVVLYLWKVSHGPHKAPIARSVHFSDFEREKSLQDDIRRIFGDRILEHIESIAGGGRSNLLTLPRNITKKLCKYLDLKDIVKLSALSFIANTIFNDNSIWKELCKRYHYTRGKEGRNYRCIDCDWKKLFKEEHIQMFLAENQTSRYRPTSVRKKTSTGRNEVDRSGDIRQKLVSGPDQKKESNFPSKKIVEKKFPHSNEVSEIRSLQNIGRANMANLRKRSTLTVNKSKTEIESKNLSQTVDKKFGKSKTVISGKKDKSEKSNITSKLSSTSMKSFDSKLNANKYKLSSTVKTAERSEKFESYDRRNDQLKLKAKPKVKEINESKSTILSSDKARRHNSIYTRDESLNLSELIEASMKNLQSPRTIFDSEFSFLEKFRSIDSNLQEKQFKMKDSLKGTKAMRMNSMLERVSEKSEPSTGKLSEIDRKIDRVTDIIPSASKELKLSGSKINKSRKKNDKSLPRTTDHESDDYIKRFDSLYTNISTPEMVNNIEIKSSNPSRPLDKLDILRSLGSNDIATKTTVKATRTRCEKKKVAEDLCKKITK